MRVIWNRCTMNVLWKCLKALKLSNFKISHKINLNDWLNYFKETLNPPVVAAKIHYAETLILNN